MKKFNYFMAYELDEFQLPLVVCDTAKELAEWLGVDVDYLYYCLKSNVPCNGVGVCCGVVL